MLNAGVMSKSSRIKKRRKSQLGTGKKLVETWIVREACEKGTLKASSRKQKSLVCPSNTLEINLGRTFEDK